MTAADEHPSVSVLGPDRSAADGPSAPSPAPLSRQLLDRIDRYWRAANYLSVGQLYLYDNPAWGSPKSIRGGDVIRMRTGDIVPADARLLEGDPVEVDQSALTGESQPAEEKPLIIAVSIARRSVLDHDAVRSGVDRCRDPGRDATVLSVTMAVGARLLAMKQAIVSRLVAIEELTGVDVLCSDKTGTLTQHTLTLGDLFAVHGVTAEEVIRDAALASRADDEDTIDLAVLGGVKDREVLESYEVVPFFSRLTRSVSAPRRPSTRRTAQRSR